MRIEDLLGDINFGKSFVNGSATVKVKGKNSICSTCKHFNGETCAQHRSFAGFAGSLKDCDDWEVCDG